MKILVAGDVSDLLIQRLGRRLDLPIERQAHATDDRYIAVCGGVVPAGMLDDPRTGLIVLVEPSLAERDRVVRELAARATPALVVVEHVAAEIMAERTWAILLSVAHGLPQAIRALERTPVEESRLVTGPPSGRSQPLAGGSGSVRGETLGFLGFGPIAWRMSSLASAAGMRVAFWPDPGAPDARDEIEGVALATGANELSFADLLAWSTYIVLDLQYSAETIRMIDAAELASMRPGAYLINTTHGRAIDEGALLQALRDRHLGGAALDRFNYEPLPADSALRRLDQAVLTPGVAVPSLEEVTDETARQIAAAIVEWNPAVRSRNVLRRRRPRHGAK